MCECLFQSRLVNLVKHDVDIVTGVSGTTVIHVVAYHFDLRSFCKVVNFVFKESDERGILVKGVVRG